METAQDRLWFRLTEYARNVSYDEYVGLALFALREAGCYPEKIWAGEQIILVGM